MGVSRPLNATRFRKRETISRLSTGHESDVFAYYNKYKTGQNKNTKTSLAFLSRVYFYIIFATSGETMHIVIGQSKNVKKKKKNTSFIMSREGRTVGGIVFYNILRVFIKFRNKNNYKKNY